MTDSLVIMGVAGCGKSSLGACVAQATGMALIEGDDFHSSSNRDKMSQGIALTDTDREGWLANLGEQLRARPAGVVLTCSALKKTYRDKLRSASPGLRFVFMEITRAQAEVRVADRAGQHFFNRSLVDSQFATLQVPSSEAGVLTVDALQPLSLLQTQVSQWLANPKEAP